MSEVGSRSGGQYDYKQGGKKVQVTFRNRKWFTVAGMEVGTGKWDWRKDGIRHMASINWSRVIGLLDI